MLLLARTHKLKLICQEIDYASVSMYASHCMLSSGQRPLDCYIGWPFHIPASNGAVYLIANAAVSTCPYLWICFLVIMCLVNYE